MNDKHVTMNIAGVRVTFPFEPYDIQRKYMECVIEAAKGRKNALLESPTGTGKTLSLLCSSLAWQQNDAPKGTMIFYTSRTHIQLNQAAKEMKRTAYARVPSVVIASRTHMCLNDEVKDQAVGQDWSINRACKNAITKNACSYYSNYEQKLESTLDPDKVNDIEDLYNFGRANQCCPYYASKKLAESKASLVFMPYNYLLDLSIQKSVQLKLDNSIIIFDEGHNIESALKDSASGHFTQAYLSTIQDSCDKLPQKLNDVLNKELHGLSRYGYEPKKKRSAIVDEFSKKSNKDSDKAKENKPNPIEELAEKLTNDKLQKVNRCANFLLSCKDMMNTKEGRYRSTKCSIETVYRKMNDAGVTFESADMIITTLDSMASFWSIAGVMSPSVIAKYLAAITNLSHFISLFFPPGFLSKEGFDRHVDKLNKYHSAYLEAHFEETTVLKTTNKLLGWQMNLWCLRPAIGLDRVVDNSCVMGPRSLIITSGTLAPMPPMIEELGREFCYVKEFNHLITKNQFKITILGESPTHYSLRSTHEDTKKVEYAREIGESLLSLFKVLPYGTLVFFPSYALMNKVTSYWERSSLLNRQMIKATKIFKEAKDQSTFSDDMINYKKTIDGNNKAVFIGVCRGKLSEGTNLEANHCRSVIIVGLPFPSRQDPKIIETLEFHHRKGDDGGSKWYSQQMKRALNQAIGRVIRSKNDFGMLFLCDPRFTHYKLSLSQWVREFYPDHPAKDYASLVDSVKDFFGHHNIDISSLSIADANGSSQNGVFEFDQSTKTNNRVFPVMKNTAGSQNSYGSLRSSNELNRIDQAESVKDLRAQMLSDYTVDRATYQKVKQNLKHATAKTESTVPVKKLKTTKDVFESVFSQITDHRATDPQPNGAVTIDVIEIDDDGADPDSNLDTNTNANATNSNAEVVAQPNLQPAKPKSPVKPPSAQAKFRCYICKNTSVRPHVINCECARIGCYTCLKGLNNKACGDCGTGLKLKKFKQKLFNVFQKREV